MRNPAYANLPKKQAMEQYQKGQFTKPLIDRVRRAVWHRIAATTKDGRRCISVEELQQCILHEVVDTPATYADSWNVGVGTAVWLESWVWATQLDTTVVQGNVNIVTISTTTVFASHGQRRHAECLVCRCQ